MPTPRSAIVQGALLALAAAVAFGVTTPAVHRFGAGAGPLATACALYAGAAAAALLALARARVSATGAAGTGSDAREARVRWVHLPRIALVAFAGAAVAPTALAWGLQRADATRASLLLNLEAVFTVVLARLCFREAVGARVLAAVVLMVAGGSVVVATGARMGAGAGLGLAAVVTAALAWAVDNALTRPLADLDPTGVVAWKAGLGALATGALSTALGEAWPHGAAAVVLLVCGATGYGMSLRLYLLAQRRIGAARTASLFAVAPFVGAIVAWAVGEGRLDGGTLVGGVLFVVAVALHLSEKHAHTHTHDALAHEHAHRHDDGHHVHAHPGDAAIDPTVEHSHPHVHAPTTHTHDHGPDIHHAHRHDDGVLSKIVKRARHTSRLGG